MSEVELILASQSAARRAMLENVGLDFSCVPADIDEGSVMELLRAEGVGISDIASGLAVEKALAVAKNNSDALVIGSDQILEFEGKILTKATSPENARAKLQVLKGKTHKLISAVTVARGDEILWQYVDDAQLTMHDFDDALLDEYCARAGAALTRSVGAYEIESHGAWLFSSVQGDYFTIMGMPLLPLLGFLREQGCGL